MISHCNIFSYYIKGELPQNHFLFPSTSLCYDQLYCVKGRQPQDYFPFGNAHKAEFLELSCTGSLLSHFPKHAILAAFCFFYFTSHYKASSELVNPLLSVRATDVRFNFIIFLT